MHYLSDRPIHRTRERERAKQRTSPQPEHLGGLLPHYGVHTEERDRGVAIGDPHRRDDHRGHASRRLVVAVCASACGAADDSGAVYKGAHVARDQVATAFRDARDGEPRRAAPRIMEPCAAALLGGNCFVGATPKGKLTDSEFKLASWGTSKSFPSPPPHYMYTLVSLVYTLSPHMDTVSLSRLGPELAGHDRGDGQVERNQ